MALNVLGIDPGLNGALAMWDGKELTLLEIPTAKSTGRGNEVIWPLLNEQWDAAFFWADHVFMERVGARPGQGVSSMFKFGLVFGGLHGMIAAKLLPLTLVTPVAWMAEMQVGRGSKEASVIRATQLFPTYASRFRGPKGGRKDGVAEAALIAKYGFDILTRDS